MWSSVAAVLAFVGVSVAFMSGEDEEPLALSRRATILTAISTTALLGAAALAVVGLASWAWTGTAAGWSAALATGRIVLGWFKRADDYGISRERDDAIADEPAAKAPPERLPDVWQSLPRF